MAFSAAVQLAPSPGGSALAAGAPSTSGRIQSEHQAFAHKHPVLSLPLSYISKKPSCKPHRALQFCAAQLQPRQKNVRNPILHSDLHGDRLISFSVPSNQTRQPAVREKFRASATGGAGRPVSPIDPVGGTRKQRNADPLGKVVNHPSGSLIGALAQTAFKNFAKSTAETLELFRDLPPSDLTDTVPPEALADPDSKFVDVGKVRVHYKEYAKQGLSSSEVQRLPTILLLHGFAGSTWSFRKVMADMAESLDGYRVIAFDRPPFGLTSRPLDVQPGAPDNPYTAEGAARLMLGLMDTLNIKKAVAMGHSAGAPIVIDAALLAPERITALGLLAPAVFVDKSALSRGGLYAQLRLLYTRALLGTPGIGLNYVRQMYRKRRAEVNKGALTYADKDKVTNEDIEGYIKPMMAHDWDRASLLQFQSFGFEPVGDRIKDLKVPVLILQGDLDKAVPVQAARSLAGVLRDVTDTSYVELENCGHQPMEEFPEVFVGKVAKFLESLPDRATAVRHALRKDTEDIDISAEAPISGSRVTAVEAAPSAL